MKLGLVGSEMCIRDRAWSIGLRHGGEVLHPGVCVPGVLPSTPYPLGSTRWDSCPLEIPSPYACMCIIACGHLLRGVGIPAFTLPGCSHTDGRHSQWETIELIPLSRSGHVVPAYPPADCAGGVLVPVRDNGIMCMSGMRRNIPLNRVDMLFLTPGRQQDVLDLSCCSARSFWRSAVCYRYIYIYGDVK